MPSAFLGHAVLILTLWFNAIRADTQSDEAAERTLMSAAVETVQSTAKTLQLTNPAAPHTSTASSHALYAVRYRPQDSNDLLVSYTDSSETLHARVDVPQNFFDNSHWMHNEVIVWSTYRYRTDVLPDAAFRSELFVAGTLRQLSGTLTFGLADPGSFSPISTDSMMPGSASISVTFTANTGNCGGTCNYECRVLDRSSNTWTRHVSAPLSQDGSSVRCRVPESRHTIMALFHRPTTLEQHENSLPQRSIRLQFRLQQSVYGEDNSDLNQDVNGFKTRLASSIAKSTKNQELSRIQVQKIVIDEHGPGIIVDVDIEHSDAQLDLSSKRMFAMLWNQKDDEASVLRTTDVTRGLDVKRNWHFKTRCSGYWKNDIIDCDDNIEHLGRRERAFRFAMKLSNMAIENANSYDGPGGQWEERFRQIIQDVSGAMSHSIDVLNVDMTLGHHWIEFLLVNDGGNDIDSARNQFIDAFDSSGSDLHQRMPNIASDTALTSYETRVIECYSMHNSDWQDASRCDPGSGNSNGDNMGRNAVMVEVTLITTDPLNMDDAVWQRTFINDVSDALMLSKSRIVVMDVQDHGADSDERRVKFAILEMDNSNVFLVDKWSASREFQAQKDSMGSTLLNGELTRLIDTGSSVNTYESWLQKCDGNEHGPWQEHCGGHGGKHEPTAPADGHDSRMAFTVILGLVVDEEHAHEDWWQYHDTLRKEMADATRFPEERIGIMGVWYDDSRQRTVVEIVFVAPDDDPELNNGDSTLRDVQSRLNTMLSTNDPALSQGSEMRNIDPNGGAEWRENIRVYRCEHTWQFEGSDCNNYDEGMPDWAPYAMAAAGVGLILAGVCAVKFCSCCQKEKAPQIVMVQAPPAQTQQPQMMVMQQPRAPITAQQPLMMMQPQMMMQQQQQQPQMMMVQTNQSPGTIKYTAK